jgi:hypothetical protein
MLISGRVVTEPGADRGPHAGSPRGVVAADPTLNMQATISPAERAVGQA